MSADQDLKLEEAELAGLGWTARVYQSMSLEHLRALRVAFQIDRARATSPITRRFCDDRLALIDHLLREAN